MTLRLFAYIKNETTNEQVGVSAGTQVSQAATHEDGRRVSVGTSEATITFDTNVADAGYLVLINRDDTNYVEIGFATTVYVMKLKAGESAVLRLAPSVSAIYAKANTAAIELQYKLFED